MVDGATDIVGDGAGVVGVATKYDGATQVVGYRTARVVYCAVIYVNRTRVDNGACVDSMDVECHGTGVGNGAGVDDATSGIENDAGVGNAAVVGKGCILVNFARVDNGSAYVVVNGDEKADGTVWDIGRGALVVNDPVIGNGGIHVGVEEAAVGNSAHVV